MAPQLLLTYDFPPIGGGIARWMAELAKRYPPGTLVVSTGQHPDAADVDATFPNRVDRLPLPARRLRSLQGLLHWSRRAAVLTRQCGVEFIWCGNMKPASYPAKWTMERLGTPFGVLLHGGDLLILQHQVHQSLLKRRTARALLASAAVLVANSQWTRECCLTLLSELEIESADSQVQVVPLGADHVFFRPGVDTTAVRARYGLGEGRWLLSVARLARHKGIDTALLALAQLRDRYSDLRYAVVGTGEELERAGGARRPARRRRPGALSHRRPRPRPARHLQLRRGLSRRLAADGAAGRGLRHLASRRRPPAASRSSPDGAEASRRRYATARPGCWWTRRAPRRWAMPRVLLDDAPLRARLGAAGRRAVETLLQLGPRGGRPGADRARVRPPGRCGRRSPDGPHASRAGRGRRVRQPVPHLAGAARPAGDSISTGASPTSSGASGCCCAATRPKESGCSISAAWTGCSPSGSSRWARRRWATTSRPPRSRRPSSSATPRLGPCSPRYRRDRASSI